MTMSPFDHQSDPELGRMLREQLTGPAPEAFLRRLRLAVAGAGRGTQWDVLAHWAEPRVMAAAIAAGFLIWLGAWFAAAGPAGEQGVTIASLPAHTVVMSRVSAQDEFVSAVMEDR